MRPIRLRCLEKRSPCLKEGDAAKVVIAAHTHASGEGSEPRRHGGESFHALKRHHERLENAIKARNEKVTVKAVVDPCPVSWAKMDRNVSREMRKVVGNREEACDVTVTVRPDPCVWKGQGTADVAEVGSGQLSRQGK